MPRIPAFAGPAYRSQSLTAAADRCINLYPESLENSGEVKQTAVLYPTPGIAVWLTLPTGPVSELFQQNGRVFCVAGSGFYELFGNQTYTLRGTVAVGPRQATICSNGTAGDQVFIVAGLFGYIFTLSTNAFSNIFDLNFPNGAAAMGRFVDSYFAVLIEGTTQWRVSTLLDGMTWPGLDTAQRSFAADSIVNLAVTHREVWLLGSQTSEVWYNSGATFPFQPIAGVFLEAGCGAVDSVKVVDNTLYWLAQTVNGSRMIVRANGYRPERISTHAIEYALQSYQTVDDAKAYAYQDQGHTFYVLTIPSQAATWVYDTTTGLWHERAAWDTVTGSYMAQRQACHCLAFGLHLVGDRNTGAVYRQSIDLTSDVDTLIRRQRTMIHLTDDLNWSFFPWATLDLETGLGTPSGQGSDPQVMLRYSNDGGKTYGPDRMASAGAQGKYGRRARWTRLGRGRDRVFDISMTDPIPWRLSNLYLDVRQGTS